MKVRFLPKKNISTRKEYEKHHWSCRKMEEIYNYTVSDIGIDKRIYDRAFYGTSRLEDKNLSDLLH